jgi:DNA repair photolyase
MSTPPNAPALKIDLWGDRVRLERNNFIAKSLSAFAVNIAVGCKHGCKYCYVPATATNKQKGSLRAMGVQEPGLEWGSYLAIRKWDPQAFLRDVIKAESIPASDLPEDSNRAVLFCSTTDPYQAIPAGINAPLARLADNIVTEALTLILNHSTLNVRILTRSGAAVRDFGLYEKFADQGRILFGMSFPTTNEALQRVYEPTAPSPQSRLKALEKARDRGIPTYVAMAPTYPECDEADLRATLTAIAKLDLLTVFHEPINQRLDNVERIRDGFAGSGYKGTPRTEVFKKENWSAYALEQLRTVERLANELGIGDRLHLWPDKKLLASDAFIARQPDPKAYRRWVTGWNERVSPWPKPRKKPTS